MQNAIEPQQPLILNHHSLILIDPALLIGDGKMPGWPIRDRVWRIASVKDLMQIGRQPADLLRFHQEALSANRRDRFFLAIDVERVKSHQSVPIDGQMLLSLTIRVVWPRLGQTLFMEYSSPKVQL